MKIVSLFTLIVCLQFTALATVANANELKVKNRDEAIQLVKREYSGKILKVESTEINDHAGYQVKLISDQGVVYSLSVDATTGLVSLK